MELRRADIGFGRVIVDDAGVTRRGLFRTRRIGWNDISEYALEIIPTADPYDPYRYGETPIGELAYARDVVQGKHHVYLVSVELRGGAQPVAFGWRFKDAHVAIHEIVERVHDRLAERAREQFERVKLAAFGPLGITADSIGWGATSLPRDRVEALEVFDARPLELRVMERDRARPFAHASTRGVPNLFVALALARELGYPTRGAALVREAFARPPRDILRVWPG